MTETDETTRVGASPRPAEPPFGGVVALTWRLYRSAWPVLTTVAAVSLAIQVAVTALVDWRWPLRHALSTKSSFAGGLRSVAAYTDLSGTHVRSAWLLAATFGAACHSSARSSS